MHVFSRLSQCVLDTASSTVDVDSVEHDRIIEINALFIPNSYFSCPLWPNLGRFPMYASPKTTNLLSQSLGNVLHEAVMLLLLRPSSQPSLSGRHEDTASFIPLMLLRDSRGELGVLCPVLHLKFSVEEANVAPQVGAVHLLAFVDELLGKAMSIREIGGSHFVQDANGVGQLGRRFDEILVAARRKSPVGVSDGEAEDLWDAVHEVSHNAVLWLGCFEPLLECKEHNVALGSRIDVLRQRALLLGKLQKPVESLAFDHVAKVDDDMGQMDGVEAHGIDRALEVEAVQQVEEGLSMVGLLHDSVVELQEDLFGVQCCGDEGDSGMV